MTEINPAIKLIITGRKSRIFMLGADSLEKVNQLTQRMFNKFGNSTKLIISNHGSMKQFPEVISTKSI